jgi:hypothetical protein
MVAVMDEAVIMECGPGKPGRESSMRKVRTCKTAATEMRRPAHAAEGHGAATHSSSHAAAMHAAHAASHAATATSHTAAMAATPTATATATSERW